MNIQGGHLVAKYLKEVEGVHTVFALSGGQIESILDGLTEYRIRAIDTRHEQTAAMAAHAWSVYTGRTGVCLVTAGPGFTNALTGIANAFLDNAPMVVLCGRHPLREDLRGAFQEMNQLDMVKPVTKWAATCYETRRIPEYLSMGFRYAATGRPGPVFLELPPDILSVRIPEEDAPLPRQPARRYTVHPDDADLKRAAGLINSAKQPLFLGGSGVGFSRCGDVLERFIEMTGIPFLLMNTGRGELPDDHPFSLWDVGSLGMMTALGRTDLVVIAGLRLNWLLQFGGAIPAAAKIVRIDIDPHEIDRNRTADAGLAGDVGSVLAELLRRVDGTDHSKWRKTLREAAGPFIASEQKAREIPSHPVHPVRLAAQIHQVVGKDAYYVADGGDTSYFGQVHFSSRLKTGVLAPSGGLLGCLGTGIPFAMTAKLVHPDKPVILLNGDGSFGLNSMEFDTMARHRIPVVCVINNDSAWGMLKHGQEMSIGKDRLQCTELELRRYDKMVEALGGHGEFVTRDEEIIPALERALASGKPACVNVVTDPDVMSPAAVFFYQSLKDIGQE